MKGYFCPSGFMGFVDGGYMLFASDTDYMEFLTANSSGKCAKS